MRKIVGVALQPPRAPIVAHLAIRLVEPFAALPVPLELAPVKRPAILRLDEPQKPTSDANATAIAGRQMRQISWTPALSGCRVVRNADPDAATRKLLQTLRHKRH